MRPTHGDVSLNSDGQGHVDRGAERDGRHGVQEVNIPCHNHYVLALLHYISQPQHSIHIYLSQVCLRFVSGLSQVSLSSRILHRRTDGA